MAPAFSSDRLRLIERVVTTLLLVYAVVVVGAILAGGGRYQWDFAAYYHAASVHAAGLDPYDLDRLSSAAGTTITTPFVYPPAALGLFRPFLLLDLRAASILFLLLKSAAFAALFIVWRRFVPEGSGYTLLLAIFCAMAFREAVKGDFRTGNISLFEQLPLWLGMWALLRGRSWGYVAGVLLAASMKGTLILLLPLVLIDRDRRAVMAFGAGAAIFGAYHLAQYLAAPELYVKFLRAAAALDERGSINPSSLALVRDGVDLMMPGDPRGRGIAWGIYGAYVAAVLAAAYAVLRRRDLRTDRIAAIVTAALIYGLIVPRFKGYSYTVVVLPALIAVMAAFRRPALRIAAIALICISLFAYYPLVALLAVAAAYGRKLRMQNAEITEYRNPYSRRELSR